MNDQPTICAPATLSEAGPIALIRVSGGKAIEIADTLFRSKVGNKRLSDRKANTLHVGMICEEAEIVDEVVVSLFRAPHSFTGEDVVEISCHGSVYIRQRILELLIANGAQMARPGEFTQRAFLNGKMDLSQAEAVADLVASTNRTAQRVAMQQMRGGFSSELADLRDQLLHFIALVELELDFSEEDVEFADREQLRQLTEQVSVAVDRLKDSYRLGNVIRKGIPVAIVGETNVGKSTLLNALLNEDRAIVSDIHGTTRDVIEDTVNIRGTLFRFFDTAGIREAIDAIEKMGIERTYNTLKEASVVLLVVDVTNALSMILWRINKIRELTSPDQHLIIVANKIDLGTRKTTGLLKTIPLKEKEQLVFLSAKKRDNLDELVEKMQYVLISDRDEAHDTIVTNARHYEALTRAAEALERVIKGMDDRISGEFLARDIRDSMDALGEITGQITNDEILSHIFRNFCIGK